MILCELPRPGDPARRPERSSGEVGRPGRDGPAVTKVAGSRPLVGVLGVQGDVSEHVAALERAGARARWIKRPEDLAKVVGLVLPGGESTTLRRLLDYEGLLERIREKYAEGMAIFGTCAGTILLATEVQGAPAPHLSLVPMTVRRNAYGRQRDSFVTELEVEGLEGGPLEAIFIRAPIIERVGPDVNVLARVDGEIVLAETDRALVASFHPELTDDLRLHRRFLGKLGRTGRVRSSAGLVGDRSEA